MEVSLVWQFTTSNALDDLDTPLSFSYSYAFVMPDNDDDHPPETRDLFNWDGGSVYRLDGGAVLVAFTSPYSQRVYNHAYSMYAYEVDKDGEAMVSMAVPHATGSLENTGGCRFVPWKSINGESTSCPFSAGAINAPVEDSSIQR